jgi:hypothetical protein
MDRVLPAASDATDAAAAPDTAPASLENVTWLVSGLRPTSAVQEILADQVWRLRFEPSLAPPTSRVILRCETTTGWGLDDPELIECHWHRPPYVLPIQLVRYAPQSALREVLDSAVVVTRGSRVAFEDRVVKVAARLVRDWLAGTSRGAWDADATGLWQHGLRLVSAKEERRPRRGGGTIDRLRRVCRDRLCTEWWSVGSTPVSMAGVVRTGRLGAIDWRAPINGSHYLADPFPWPGTGKLLCEEMPVRGGKGRIIAIDAYAPAPRQRDGAAQQVILETAQHHSYPATLCVSDVVWLLPVATVRGSTTLYRLHGDGALTEVAAIAKDRRLADPTLFRHDGRYWIACTDLDVGMHDNLCLLHAARPEGPWLPHRLWPVRIDIRGARPAGSLFDLDGQLHRPGQDCAATYGAAIAIHRVDVLTPDAYEETLVCMLRPDPTGPFPDGLHTVVHDGTRCWVDGKRFVPHPLTAMHRVLDRLRSMLSRRQTA